MEIDALNTVHSGCRLFFLLSSDDIQLTVFQTFSVLSFDLIHTKCVRQIYEKKDFHFCDWVSKLEADLRLPWSKLK